MWVNGKRYIANPADIGSHEDVRIDVGSSNPAEDDRLDEYAVVSRTSGTNIPNLRSVITGCQPSVIVTQRDDVHRTSVKGLRYLTVTCSLKVGDPRFSSSSDRPEKLMI